MSRVAHTLVGAAVSAMIVVDVDSCEKVNFCIDILRSRRDFRWDRNYVIGRGARASCPTRPRSLKLEERGRRIGRGH